MFDFRLHLSNSCQHDCVRFALRPFLTTFEEQQKKAFFTISLIIWHKDMNIKILMGMSSYILSTLPQNKFPDNKALFSWTTRACPQ